MLVKCISLDKISPFDCDDLRLTVGKLYEVSLCTPSSYLLVNDIDESIVIDRRLFKDIKDIRNDKLAELGI